MPTPTLLLFDLGGVLIENATFERLNRLLPQPFADAAIRERWLHSPAVRRFESGEISPADFAEMFMAEWGVDLPLDAFLEEFTGWPTGFYPEARETLRILRQTYRVACLSNSNVLHWQKFAGFVADFDRALSSHLLGVLKPDPESFLYALARCDAAPSDTWFFDDSPANVRSAQALGITAFQVDGFGELRDLLRREGLFPSSRSNWP